MLKLVKWLVSRLSTRDRMALALHIITVDTVDSVTAEKIVSEVVRDSKNKIVSFIVKD